MSKEIQKNSLQEVEDRIFTIRGARVMIDRDLAEMYQVGTQVLNQAVKRNFDRFPEKFRFQLTKDEIDVLKSKIVTSNSRSQIVTLNKSGTKQGGNINYLPSVFTELQADAVSIITKINSL